MEELTRALTSGDESRSDAAKERSALLQQLHGAEQVTFTFSDINQLTIGAWSSQEAHRPAAAAARRRAGMSRFVHIFT